MRALKSITPFALQSITTDQFRWLHTEAWEDKHYEFFIEKRAKYSFSHFRDDLKQSENQRQPRPMPAQRWILNHQAEPSRPLGWVEATKITGTYQRGFVLFHLNLTNQDDGWQCAALVHFASALFIAGKLDVLTIQAVEKDLEDKFSNLYPSWDWNHDVLNVQKKTSQWMASKAGPIIRGRTARYDAPSWWERADAQAEKRKLSYLERRVTRIEQPSLKEKLSERRKKGGLLSLFFGQRR